MTISEIITLAALAVTAVATTVLAIATTVLAKATNRLVAENQKMVAENSRIIAAAESEAKASLATVDEIKRDRELGFRPYLTFEITRGTPDDPYAFGTPPPPVSPANTDVVHVVNYGRGPAISAMFCELLATSWRRTVVFDLSPEDEADLDVTRHPGLQRPTANLLKAQDHAGRWVAIFGEDLFGNRFRFRPRIADPDVWRPGDPAVDWATWYAEQKFLD